MATLTGHAVQDRYKDYCQISNANSGIDATKRAIEDGEGTASKLELSTTAVNVISGFELNDVAAQTGSVLKHEVGGLEFDASAIADGGVVVGTATGTMAIRTGVLTGGASGFLKHELGGLEFNASAIADGGIIVGTASGTMALRAGAFTAGAAGFLKHEVGGIEADISAITTDNFLVGTSSGTVGVRTASQTRTHLGLVTGTSSGNVPLVGTASATDTLAGLAEIATQAEQETGTDTARVVTPGRQQFHPSAAKFWCKFDGTDAGPISPSVDYNVVDITDNGTGDYTINISTDFSSGDYVVNALTGTGAQYVHQSSAAAPAAGTFRIGLRAHDGGVSNGDVYAVGFGDQ